jgi:hypothetical protein
MDRTQLLLAATPLLGFLIAVASPAIVSLSRARYSRAQVGIARRMLWPSAYVVAVAVCHVSGVSLAPHFLNVIIEVFAVVFGLGLAGFSFVLRPRAVGILAGLCALVAWLMLMLFLSMGAMFDGGDSAREVKMPDGSICLMAVYGFVASDSGVDIGRFRRFVFVDKRIAAHRFSDIYPDDDDLVYPDQASLKQCLAAFYASPGPARGI